MILVNVTWHKNHIVTFEASGHALHAPHGKDIVCASASTIFIVTANAIESLGYHNHVAVEVKDGYFLLSVKTYEKQVDQLLRNALNAIEQLETQFPNYIKYQKKEG